MHHSGIGYLAGALPEGWDRWKDEDQEQWLRGVESAKERVARAERARLSAAMSGVESAMRQGVGPRDAEEIGHQGLAHGLPPEQFRPFSNFVAGRAHEGASGEGLRRDIQAEAERRSHAEAPAPEVPRGGRDTGGNDRGGDQGRGGRDDNGGGREGGGGRNR